MSIGLEKPFRFGRLETVGEMIGDIPVISMWNEEGITVVSRMKLPFLW